MKRIVLVLLVTILFVGSTAMAFDGVRKGFVLGGGIGFAPTIKAETVDNGETLTDDESGTGINLFLGYAWDEFNMLVYEGNLGIYNVESILVMQGIDAVTWYHYFGPSGQSFFTAFGLGLYDYDVDIQGFPDMSRKMGILLGVGYEFSRHWQAGLYISTGKTEYSPLEIDHTTVSLLIGGVAF